MTASKQPRTCDSCRWDGGWHYDDEGNASRCPNWITAEQAERVAKLRRDESTSRFRAAREIVHDAAKIHAEFSANNIRAELESAQIPGAVVGAAFSWAQREGLIEATGRTVPSTDEGTHAHRLFVWRSLVRNYGRAS